MKKRVSVVFVLVLMSSFVLADISLLEPYDVYNLGDRLYIEADGLIGSESGNFNIELICGNRTTNLVKIPARSFSGEEELSYSVPYKILNVADLEVGNLSDIIGTCQIVARLGGAVASTKSFMISDDISVVATLDKMSYNPGEAIRVDISAVKANGVLLNGFVQVDNATSFNKAVVDGAVHEIFMMPSDTAGGTYDLSIHVYDNLGDGALNEGFGVVSFDINQVANLIVLSLSDNVVVPGTSLSVGAELYDQVGVAMEGSVSVKVVSPEGVETEVAVQANEFADIPFKNNATAGAWYVFANFGELVESREISVAELQKVEFDVEDGVLTIVNVGNSVYNKSISLEIGNETRVLDLEIGRGEIRKFKLNAPNGEHMVAINDGESSFNRNVMLTGNAISISDLKTVGIFKGYSIVWIFLIVVLGGVGAVFYIRYKRRKRRGIVGGSGIGTKFGMMKTKVAGKVPSGFKERIANSLHFTKKSPGVQGLDSKNYSHEDSTMVDFTKKNIGTAESSLVLKGEKSSSAIIALKIGNELKSEAKSSLTKIVEDAGGSKGLVDWRGDFVFVVFSPLVTKTFKNEELAVKAGSKILNGLDSHNKKFKDKIEFNIGVHSGELVASRTGGKLKYTGIGNTISLAKRIADSDSGKLLVSEAVRKKMLRDLKVVKDKEIGEHIIYSVSEIKNREANEAKLKDLLGRMKE